MTLAVNRYHAGIDTDEVEYRFDQGRFAAAIHTDQAEKLARLDLQIDTVQHSLLRITFNNLLAIDNHGAKNKNHSKKKSPDGLFFILTVTGLLFISF
jgi:hypothetical protein